MYYNMDELENLKSHGFTHHNNKFKNKCYDSRNSRSHYWWGKQDKVRGLRRKADRNSHHRRRNHIRNIVANKTIDSDTIPPSSSTKKYGNDSGHSWGISNRSVLSTRVGNEI